MQMPTLPSRDVLREVFDSAVRRINELRGSTIDLTTDFYAQIGNSVFEAGYSALGDFCDAEANTEVAPRLHVVSAPVGGGKTSFSMALMVAVTKVAEANPDAPYGCLFLVDQIDKADQMYRDLEMQMPGKVAVWTMDHDVKCKNPTRVLRPAARFAVGDLSHYPVVIVTHNFFTGKRGSTARNVTRGGHTLQRALPVVDERPEEVTVFDVELSAAQAVRELIEKDTDHADHIGPHINALVRFMHDKSFTKASLDKPTITEPWEFDPSLRWFTTPAAHDYVRHNKANESVAAVFGFAKALVNGYAFVNRAVGSSCRFIGYETNLLLAPGMMLLDATADIDGVSQLCSWRTHAAVPQAQYDNLSIVHVPPHTKSRLSSYLTSAKNRRAYVDWMLETIKQNMKPGERGLVVCKLAPFKNEDVPAWPKGDRRFAHRETYTQDYGWELDGRLLCATHWGTGVGVNSWRDADVVFLFDEYHLPRRIIIATAQGLQQHKSTEGALAKMNTINTKAHAVDALSEGHLLRWTKQMALRGRGRCFDAQGNCGQQRLVVSGSLKRLLANKGRIFPGAQVVTSGQKKTDDKQTHADALLRVLSMAHLPDPLGTRVIASLMKVEWRDVWKNLTNNSQLQQAIAGLGWTYVSRKGCGGSYFKRTKVGLSFAA
jgi:hypothetical protein